MTFIQNPPELPNQYTDDPILASYLEIILPDPMFITIKSDLFRLGNRTTAEILDAGNAAMKNEPILQQFDAWGNRVDQIVTDSGWDTLRAIAAEEGLISIGFRQEHSEFSRIYQMAKMLLYTPSSAIYTCPLAMTDGAAVVIREMADYLQDDFQHLTSNDPNEFWTAGQWMTEKEGGSDVGRSSTIARHVSGSTYQLFGDKWFTSAITGDVAMTLARIEDETGEITPGSRGLSLFYLKIRENGTLNNITIHRLKDKLGTRALPTAELTLNGAEAQLIGTIGRGVKQITTILNITRIYNAVSSLAYMQRGLALIKDYSSKREAFGKLLKDLPLHQEVLVDLECQYLGSFLMVFYVIELLGKVETGKATMEEEAQLRILTPLVKLYTGKQAVAFMSEVVEAFGGQGYVEDTGLPALLRDAQVFSIWEGTTNVLSLDVLRSIAKESSLQPLLSEIGDFTTSYQGGLDISVLIEGLHILVDYAGKLDKIDSDLTQLAARRFSLSLSRLVIMFRLCKFHDELPEIHLKRKIEIVILRQTTEKIIDLINLDSSILQQNHEFLDLDAKINLTNQ